VGCQPKSGAIFALEMIETTQLISRRINKLGLSPARGERRIEKSEDAESVPNVQNDSDMCMYLLAEAGIVGRTPEREATAWTRGCPWGGGFQSHRFDLVQRGW
jgi:hypothetical protein